MIENLVVVVLSIYSCGALMSTGLLLEVKVYRQEWGWLFLAAAVLAWPLMWIAFGIFLTQKKKPEIHTYCDQPSALHEFVIVTVGSFKARI